MSDSWLADELTWSFKVEPSLECPQCEHTAVYVNPLLQEGFAECHHCGVEYTAEITQEGFATDGGTVDGATREKKSADDAEIADEKPKKTCEWVESHGHGACGETAVKAVWMRVDSRVNGHGVHISTKVRPVWVCKEHASRGQDVPDAEAEVVTRR